MTCLVQGYHGAEVAKVAKRAGMSKVAEKAKMSEMLKVSKGMSSMSIFKMKPCPSRASR